MDDPEISLRQYIERIIDEKERAGERIRKAEQVAVDIAREELEHWKVAHNNWQIQMQQRESEFVRVMDHDYLSQKIDKVEKLVYIGVGAVAVLEFALKYIK